MSLPLRAVAAAASTRRPGGAARKSVEPAGRLRLHPLRHHGGGCMLVALVVAVLVARDYGVRGVPPRKAFGVANVTYG